MCWCATARAGGSIPVVSTFQEELGLPSVLFGVGLPDARARRAWEAGMAGAAAIGRSCALDLNFERYRFPGFTVPEGETPFSYLYQRAHEGLRVRYRPITRQAVKQLAHELEIIERTNLAEFFLIVWDLMEFARTNGIIGQGRGSAGDSIVAYCLGITKVDPIAHKLLFERFINEARTLPARVIKELWFPWRMQSIVANGIDMVLTGSRNSIFE